MSGARARGRAGMTLVEVVVAVLIIGSVLLGTAEFMRRFTRANAAASLLNMASDLAAARIERVKMEHTYAMIDTLARTETNPVPSDARWQRTTVVTRVNTGAMDYKTVTVTVTHPSLASPVTKTTAIAAP